MTEAQREQRRYALAISGGVCEVCGRPLRDGQPQGAHRIGNTKANRAKYGDNESHIEKYHSFFKWLKRTIQLLYKENTSVLIYKPYL